ncbi:tetratricopeptide repeat protein [Maridesulfovibrio sp.]|uniref:tetratricopeptide repeat protein n=1 Tax=Maridesulfovibrio sp. TaxID=2795000 RepID=UPI0039F027FB
MNKKYAIGLHLFLILIIMTAGGCKSAKRAVFANYVMPPKALQTQSIEKLIVEKPVIKIKRKGINRKTAGIISDIFANAISNDFSAQLYYNGHIKPADLVYGDPDGLKQVRKIMAHSKHGYDVKIIPARNTARLKVDVRVDYTRTKDIDKIITTLTTQNYSVEYNDEGVPHAKLGSVSSSNVSSNVPYIKTKVEGMLTATLYDHKGKKIYSRTFDDLDFENKAGGNAGSHAEAPYPEVAQSLFKDAIDKVVADISPHRENRLLVVNEKGDSSAIALIKGTAFYDAQERLADITDKASEEIEKEKAATKVEYEQKIAEAADEEKRTALKSEWAEAIIDITKKYSPDFENMGIIMEIIGQRSEALEFYEQASEFDPENETAKNSVSRINEMMTASRQVLEPAKVITENPEIRSN